MLKNTEQETALTRLLIVAEASCVIYTVGGDCEKQLA